MVPFTFYTISYANKKLSKKLKNFNQEEVPGPPLQYCFLDSMVLCPLGISGWGEIPDSSSQYAIWLDQMVLNTFFDLIEIVFYPNLNDLH